MSKIVDWTPNDFSPTYRFEVDDKGGFVKLHKIFDIPTDYPQSKEIEIKQHYIDYMSGDGFDKYKEHRAWLGDELYKQD